MPSLELPAGFLAGHHTDSDGGTGCTVVLAPDGAVAGGEVRGGGPGTRESDLLSPATSTDGPQALLLTGGSAFGLGAADGVVDWMAGRGMGHPTIAGPVPLVSAAVIFDLGFGRRVWPGPADARAACEVAGPVIERGSLGAGTGATAGKLLGPAGWSKSGLGAAALDAGAARVVAIAVANPIGDVVDSDGTLLAAASRDGKAVRAVDLLREGAAPRVTGRENTTLAVVLTDARLDKRAAWLVARATAAGVARAVHPSGTAFDGDWSVCMASGKVDADPAIVAPLAAEAVAEAIRDAARCA